MKSTVCPVFVGYVVSSVYVQEKYRTSGIFYENYECVYFQEKYRTPGIFFEKYRMSGIFWEMWCVCSGKVLYVRYFL